MTPMPSQFMRPVRRIALLMSLDLSFCREVLAGVQAFATQNEHWIFHHAPPDPAVLRPLRQWNPHGIIAHVMMPEFARRAVRLGKPMVDTAYTLSNLPVPTVDVDHFAVGRLAAEHFLQRGFVHFGFFGSGRATYAREREIGFRQRLAEASHAVSTCRAEYFPRLPLGASWTKMDQRVRRWLEELPKPVAIFAINDVPARDLADMCHRLGFRVPDEVAILGVDNDETECRLASPPLSSIALPSQQIGYEAARMLDRMLTGKRAQPPSMFLPPIRVVTRQSTDTLAVTDPVVRNALDYIRQHAAEGVNVARVVQEIGAGRRELERHFRGVLGHSVLHEIRRVRVERAKELLTATDLAMPMIARRCGFSTPQRMTVVFRQFTGKVPTAFRNLAKVCEPARE
jgi:LacI family transcriptional regulator